MQWYANGDAIIVNRKRKRKTSNGSWEIFPFHFELNKSEKKNCTMFPLKRFFADRNTISRVVSEFVCEYIFAFYLDNARRQTTNKNKNKKVQKEFAQPKCFDKLFLSEKRHFFFLFSNGISATCCHAKQKQEMKEFSLLQSQILNLQ